MSTKTELMALIEELPEEKVPEAIILMKSLIEKRDDSVIAPSPLDPLDTFMAVIVHSMTNAMYDLSSDARRKEEKVMANRLETYRKKLSDGWQTYQIKKQELRE